MGSDGHHHRSGSLKQSNKKNKRPSSSKRSQNRSMGAGKIMTSSSNNRAPVKGGSISSSATSSSSSKANRTNELKQKRNLARNKLRMQSRGLNALGCSSSASGSNKHVRLEVPPKIVGIVSLSGESVSESSELEEQVRTLLSKESNASSGDHTFQYDSHKKSKLTILTNATSFAPTTQPSSDTLLTAALDLARICDVLLLVIEGSTTLLSSQSSLDAEKMMDTALLSPRGEAILQALKNQGLPTSYSLLACRPIDREATKNAKNRVLKRRMEVKKYVQRFATTEFGDGAKSLVVDLVDADTMEEGNNAKPEMQSSNSQTATLIRTLCQGSSSPPKWTLLRSNLLSQTHVYHPSTQTLELTGYLRGHPPLDIHQLIHVPTMGTFQLGSAVAHPSRNSSTGDIKLTADEGLMPGLELFADPHSLDGEQNLIGFDDLDEEEADEEEVPMARPAGWSDYQASWLEGVDENDDAQTFCTQQSIDMDHGEYATSLNKKGKDADDANDDDLDNDFAQRAAHKASLQKSTTEELEFPDELELPPDVTASTRLARYRALKSFRKSAWDARENLPGEYGKLYHFASFKSTQRDVLRDSQDICGVADLARFERGWIAGPENTKSATDGDAMEDGSEEEDELEGCIASGTYVTITLLNVPPTTYATSTTTFLTAVSLLPHEHKASVLHMNISPSNTSYTTSSLFSPLKSKTPLTLRCGWRTWTTKPIFSQLNLNCDKHKLEKFMGRQGFLALSAYGPVTYAPCPVMVFQPTPSTPVATDITLMDTASTPPNTSNNRELVAVGSMLGADADRIIIKRVILTGYPTRVHKRHATVKYMFYNPDDVKWFKPAGLSTKHGLQGHIIESVGVHGSMKCLFNAPVKQHDTVCLPLYKRVFPKFVDTSDSGGNSDDLVIL